MKNIDQTVALLGRLAHADRDWILERLPYAAKADLARRLNCADSVETASFTPPPAVAKTNDPTALYRKQLACAEVDKIAELLRGEPPWLIHALLQTAERPWRDALLQLLPASVRAEVLQAGQSGAVLSQPAIECLLRTAAERIDKGNVGVPKSQFELLLTRFGRKARRA
jgi:hypothetical protein